MDWGCQLVTESTWFGGGGGILGLRGRVRERELEINSVWVGFWVCEGEGE